MQRFSSVLVALTLVVILVSNIERPALSTSSSNTTNATFGSNSTSKLKVVASFFPIYEFVKKVGGDKVDVSVLIPIGAEPHDFDPLFNKSKVLNQQAQ